MKKIIPNIITISRGITNIIIIPLFFLDFPHKFVWIYVLFLYAACSDRLDGVLARKWKTISDFGIVFDPLLDKILSLSLYMLLIPFNIIHSSIFIILLFRDLIVDGMKNFLLSRGKAVPANNAGKIKMVFQMVLINFALLYLIFPDQQWLQQLTYISAFIALFFAIKSIPNYFSTFYSFLKTNK